VEEKSQASHAERFWERRARAFERVNYPKRKQNECQALRTIPLGQKVPLATSTERKKGQEEKTRTTGRN